MPFATHPDLETELLRMIGAWDGGRSEFRNILNKAFDIAIDPDGLMAKLVFTVGEDAPVIDGWRRGSFWPSPRFQRRIVDLIKQLVIAAS